MGMSKFCALFIVLFAGVVQAETGYEAWLRYAALDAAATRQYREVVPAAITTMSDSDLVNNARQELTRGIRGMLGRTLRVEAELPDGGAIVLGTLADLRNATPRLPLAGTLQPEGYWLKTVTINGARFLIVAGADERGVLYGSFALLRMIASGETVATLDEKQAPSAPIRWLNLWDNLGGARPGPAAATSIAPFQRPPRPGSVLFENGSVREDLSRVNDYARMLASVGINGIAISSVNADRRLLTPEFLPQLKRLAAVFRAWGVRIVMPMNFGSPKTVGGLDTFDPLDERVAAWWKSKTDELYAAVPDIAGYVMKADSEGQTGPSAYGRTIADAANAMARALRPHGGLLLYRAFVYDHKLDWRDLKNDRARAAYDYFHPLDGQFDDNVVVQIKNGPIDFQVREPASPLFSGLEKTSQAIELQIYQEYLGQGRHLVSLVPWWKDTLDFDMQVGGSGTPVKAIATGEVFQRPHGGFVGVTTTSMNDTWERSLFSQSNLYGFGRLAWNPDLSSRRVIEEWTRLTFGNDPLVVRTITDMQLRSWRVYEDYTGTLGLQTLTECCAWHENTHIPGNHFGPSVEASERTGWGQWHRADEKGVGMNRTVASGTGFIGQFRPGVAQMYESLETCPDELVLFMHHVPYTHRLHSGKTVIQHIYDSHYDGADSAAGYVRDWQALESRIDDQRYDTVLKALEFQAGAAQVWRDSIAGWFFKTSGIPDEQGRVGNYPGRIEAEAMTLEGYTPRKASHWETASGETAVECAAKQCTASFRHDGSPGWYTLNVRYFDYFQGVSRFRLAVAGQVVDEWLADDILPTHSPEPDGASSTRRLISGVALRPGDEIRIEGIPGDGETAALDYIEVQLDENR
jgi:alpha-glucuronidase